MSPCALALDWSLDGSVGAAFLVVVLATGLLYLEAVAHGQRRDHRGRCWPRNRTACFLAGLTVLVLDLYSGIGTEAETRLSVHMVEHMVMWVVVAPLLTAGAPVRLALYSLPRSGFSLRSGSEAHRSPSTVTTSRRSARRRARLLVCAHHLAGGQIDGLSVMERVQRGARLQQRVSIAVSRARSGRRCAGLYRPNSERMGETRIWRS
jgi:Cytochrome c oxidase caa3 assembly factor (Caa3_CtaG)